MMHGTLRRRILVLTAFLLVVIVSALLIGPPGSEGLGPPVEPTPTSWPRPESSASPEYGINVHMWWDPWAGVRRDWTLVQDAGFTWVKQPLAWQNVEGAGPGAYEWRAADLIVEAAEQAGVRLVFRVDHPPDWAVPAGEALEIPVSLEAWEGFCTTLASRYAGRVHGYQIWNEPNLAREWGGYVPNAAGYAQLLRTCYVAIKTVDPQALVISAGLAPTGSPPPEAIPDTEYLRAFYEAGAAPYFDLLGLNAPGYKAPPEVGPAEAADPDRGYGGHAFFCFRHAEQMRAIMEVYGDADKQVAILEFGWHTASSPDHPDYAWFAVTPEEQADYLVRAFAYAREHWAPWVGPMFVWNLPDPSWTPANEEYWWSIVDPFWWGFDGDFEAWGGGALRPAYEALKGMEKP